MEITVLFWSFFFLVVVFRNIWKDFPAGEWYFRSTFKKRGGWIDLLALRVSTFENQPPLDAPTKAQFENRVFAREVSQFEKEPPLDAPTKAQFSNHAWDCSGSNVLKQQSGTWMITFLHGVNIFNEKVWKSQRHCRPTSRWSAESENPATALMRFRSWYPL